MALSVFLIKHQWDIILDVRFLDTYDNKKKTKLDSHQSGKNRFCSGTIAISVELGLILNMRKEQGGGQWMKNY